MKGSNVGMSSLVTPSLDIPTHLLGVIITILMITWMYTSLLMELYTSSRTQMKKGYEKIQFVVLIPLELAFEIGAAPSSSTCMTMGSIVTPSGVSGKIMEAPEGSLVVELWMMTCLNGCLHPLTA